jgi:putative ABC transport system substrate-binding protein
MKRREFITLLGGAVAALPRAAGAQQSGLPVIGFLSTGSPDKFADQMRAFHQSLSEAGYVEGRNVTIEYRWARSEYDRLQALAVDLVRRQVTVLTTVSIYAAQAAMAATATIPVVFYIAIDPVEQGYVASLNRPGGNLTGVSNLNVELGPKRLELLHELVPTDRPIALLLNPTNPNAQILSRNLREAGRTLGQQVHVLHVNDERHINATFAMLDQMRAGGLVIGTDPFFVAHVEQLATLALRHAVPTISQYREFVTAGGLMSYGASLSDGFRLLGVYTGRILKGEKPADLPVQQATKAELIINLKTARALGLTVPLSLLGRADEVIE